MYVAKEPLFAGGICIGDVGTVVSKKMVEMFDLGDKVDERDDIPSEDERIAASTPTVTETRINEPVLPEQSATDAAEGDASMVGTTGTGKAKAGK